MSSVSAVPSSIIRHTLRRTPEESLLVDPNPNGSVPSGLMVNISPTTDGFEYEKVSAGGFKSSHSGIWKDAQVRDSKGQVTRELDDIIQADEVTHIQHLPGKMKQNHQIPSVTDIVHSITLDGWHLIETVQHIFPGQK